MEHKNGIIIQGSSGRIYKTTRQNIRTGITSKLVSTNTNNKTFLHIPLMDFDNYDLSKLISHLKHFKMRNKPRLSNIYIFKTSPNHFSAMCFTPLQWIKYKHLLLNIDVDPNFRYYTIKRKEATLRLSPKHDKKNSNLKFVYTIKSINNNLEVTELKDSIFKLVGIENGL